jgi:Zn-dependent peptidase ImmA (M78 family)
LQARRVREELGLAPIDPIDPAQYLTHLTRSSEDRRLQALGGTGRDNRNPTVVLGDFSNERARRFTLSRALWHFLADDDPIFLVTASYTNRQRIERAFAAELLAPAEGIQQRLSSDIFVEDDLEELADHFKVSARIIEHQLHNQLAESA